MWTVVYIAQKANEVFKIKVIFDKNNIISRIRESSRSDANDGMFFEILVPSAELALAQDLIIASEI